MKTSYDVVVIGAGPAGYVAAIRCAQLGLSTLCVDKWSNEAGAASPGGTCLNVGCIPSKALLESSERYEQMVQQAASHGIQAQGVEVDVAAMQARKDKVVANLTGGIQQLFRANKVDSAHGTARLLAGKQVEITPVSGGSNKNTVKGENIIIATGSVPVEIPAAELNGQAIVDSTGALSFVEVPRRLGIIGAGVIGLELGSVWRRLGAEVVLFETQDSFLSIADSDVARLALREFRKQGLDIRLGTRVTASETSGDGVQVSYEDSDGSHEQDFDRLVVAVGRHANSDGVITPECDVLLDEWGLIHVDEHCRTNQPGIYAIGDVVRGPMLAHKGSEEGLMVASLIAGHAGEVNYQTIPSIIYTEPEIAWVGGTEQDLKLAGHDIRTGQFPFAASGRAQASGATTGMVKVIADAATDRLLGVHMIGHGVSELIQQGVIVMNYGGSTEDLALTVFAHPTLSEAVHEAALAVDGRAIHTAGGRKEKGKKPQ